MTVPSCVDQTGLVRVNLVMKTVGQGTVVSQPPKKVGMGQIMAILTLAVPYYSRPDLLLKCLHSVQAQEQANWTALVCDDSPDGSAAAVVESLKDPRFVVHRNPSNLGMAENWNQCLALAQTPYVTLLHADDELLPNYSAVMPRLLDEHREAVAAFCETRIINAEGRPCFSLADHVKGYLRPRGLVRLQGESGLRAVLRGNFIMCPTVCYRREVLPRPTFNPAWRFVLDFDLFSRLLLNGCVLVGTPEAAYAYRRHEGNATTAYTRTLLRFREEARLYSELAEAAQARNWSLAAETARRKRIIRLHLAYQAARDLMRFSWGDLPEKWRLYRNL